MDQVVSKFPKFVDGDLLIRMPGSRMYQLHSGVVRRGSKILAKFLTEDWGAVLTPKAKREGVIIRYRLDLVGFETGTAHFQPIVSAHF